MDIKCELIGGGLPRHLNTFSNLFIVAVHYQYMLCIVAIMLYHVHHKISEHTISCCYC